MDYKTVMVGLALDRPNDACLRVAGDIAERFGARVIGVAASDLRPPMYFADGDFAQKLLDEEAVAILKRLSELEAEFRAAMEKRAASVEWRSARALPVPRALLPVFRLYNNGQSGAPNHRYVTMPAVRDQMLASRLDSGRQPARARLHVRAAIAKSCAPDASARMCGEASGDVYFDPAALP